MSTNDIYHSLTKIPAFITKSGLNFVNHYYDRYSTDHCSSGLEEPYYLEDYYDEMYDQYINPSTDVLSPSPFNSSRKLLKEHEDEGIPTHYSSSSHHHRHHSFTHHQNPSSSNNKRHNIYSISRSPSSSSVFSSSSSIITQKSEANDDLSSNSDIQEKNDSFIGIFKSLISKAKKSGQFLFDIRSEVGGEEDNGYKEEEKVGHTESQKSHNDMPMNHLLVSTFPENESNFYKHNNNNNNNKSSDNNLHISTRPPLYNHGFPFISKEDLLDTKEISTCSGKL